jgi:hypothetical protein
MSNSLLKTDLSNTLVEEQKKYQELILKGVNRLSGDTSFSSTSSGKTYVSTIGETDLMNQLATVLYTYHITASDWNTIINTLFKKPTIHYPNLNYPWSNLGGKNKLASYYKDLTGRVYLSGLIKSSKVGNNFGSVILNLPSGYRIGKIDTFVVEAAETNKTYCAQIYVQPNGNIVMGMGYASEWISLSGISYLAEN